MAAETETMPDVSHLFRQKQATDKRRKGETAQKALEQATGKLEAGELTEQLTIWPERFRGLPNSLARSALFSAKIGGKRADFHGVQIASLSNIRITYRGQELFQDDSSVFMSIVHVARYLPLGAVVEFTGNAILRDLGWSQNAEGYSRLRDSLERLNATALTVTMKLGEEELTYSGSLIRNFRSRTHNGEALARWQVLLEPEIIKLFPVNSLTLVEWKQRKKIDVRSPLTLWLHSFLATHRRPIPMSVEKYRELSNSGIAKLYHFRNKLKQALERLVALGFLTHYEITPNDLVVVTRATKQLETQMLEQAAEEIDGEFDGAVEFAERAIES